MKKENNPLWDFAAYNTRTIAERSVRFINDSKKQIKASFNWWKLLIFLSTFLIAVIIAGVLGLYQEAPVSIALMLSSTFLGSLALFLLTVKKPLGIILEGISIILLGINYAIFSPHLNFSGGWAFIAVGSLTFISYFVVRRWIFNNDLSEYKTPLFLTKKQWLLILCGWLLVAFLGTFIESFFLQDVHNISLEYAILFFFYTKIVSMFAIVLVFVLKGKDLFIFVLFSNISSIINWSLTFSNVAIKIDDLSAMLLVIESSLFALSIETLLIELNYCIFMMIIFISQFLISILGVGHWLEFKKKMRTTTAEDL